MQHFDGGRHAQRTPPPPITYFQGPQGPLYRKASGEADPHWYLYDGLGSVVGEVDPTGNVTASKLFDVYGATRGGSGSPTTRQGFVGGLGHQTDDETGMVYMRARYYDPGVGRFVSEDPAKDGHNWYSYCSANPVNLVDRSGKAGGSLAPLGDWSNDIAQYSSTGYIALAFAIIFCVAAIKYPGDQPGSMLMLAAMMAVIGTIAIADALQDYVPFGVGGGAIASLVTTVLGNIAFGLSKAESTLLNVVGSSIANAATGMIAYYSVCEIYCVLT